VDIDFAHILFRALIPLAEFGLLHRKLLCYLIDRKGYYFQQQNHLTIQKIPRHITGIAP
jgi:hypothetical protein